MSISQNEATHLAQNLRTVITSFGGSLNTKDAHRAVRTMRDHTRLGNSTFQTVLVTGVSLGLFTVEGETITASNDGEENTSDEEDEDNSEPSLGLSLEVEEDPIQTERHLHVVRDVPESTEKISVLLETHVFDGARNNNRCAVLSHIKNDNCEDFEVRANDSPEDIKDKFLSSVSVILPITPNTLQNYLCAVRATVKWAQKNELFSNSAAA